MFFEKLKILKGKRLFRDIKDRTSPQGQHILYLLLIAIIGIAVYSNTFNIPFHFDDTSNIVENYKLRDLNNFWPPSGSRWLGFLTFALNYHFGGLNTTGYRIVNIAIHILNAIIVYLLVILTFKTPYFMVRQAHHDATVTLSLSKGHHSPIHPFSSASGGQAYLPLFIALLFVSHPIQTQAVTYIVQRFTSLATFFYLLSLVMYIKFRSQQSAISGQQKLPATRYTLYAVSLISAILAMKTKEISFTLPLIIALYEFMFFEGKFKKRILYLIPLLLTMLIIPLSFIGIDKPIGDAIGELREAAQETEEIPKWSYLFTQFRVIVTYIRLLFLPIKQNLDYDYPRYNSFLDPNVFLSLLFLFLIFGLGVYLFYRSRSEFSELRTKNPKHKISPTHYTLNATRLIAFGTFWFFIALSVESSIIPIRDVIFEHRVYLPSVGAIVAFSSAIFYVLRFKIHNSRIFLTTYYLLLTAIVIILLIATYQRNTVWQNEVTLWEDVVRKSPYKARPYNELGLAYKDKGKLLEAILYFEKALAIEPNLDLAHSNLGNAFDDLGNIDYAMIEYQKAIEINPEFETAHYNLGRIYYKKGMFEEAAQEFKIAISLNPLDHDAKRNLELIVRTTGYKK